MDKITQRCHTKEYDVVKTLNAKWERTVKPFRRVKWVKDSEEGKRLVLTGR